MIKRITRLKRRKGFTLVECIVAIAVFALLTAVILMILANAQNQTVKSKESEEDLNNLIENVVGDDTYKKYGANSQTLTLYKGNDTTDEYFNITYDTVAGYKNYIKCNHQTGTDSNTGAPIYCGYVGNNTEFMNGKNIKDFVDAGDKYVCPKCGTTIPGKNQAEAFELICEACYNQGAYNDTALFEISNVTGSYTCVKCGSGSVKGVGIDEAITADANFMVSGLSANSIRYGEVERLDNTQSLIRGYTVTIPDPSQPENTIENKIDLKCRIETKYTADTNLIFPGVYRMTFDNIQSPRPDKIVIDLPPWYVIDIVDYSSDYKAEKDQTSLKNKGCIKITKTGGGAISDGVYVEFTLTNYKNGYSFDYDYRQPYDDKDANSYGLIGFWFRLNGRTTQRMSGDIISTDTVTKQLSDYPDGSGS